MTSWVEYHGNALLIAALSVKVLRESHSSPGAGPQAVANEILQNVQADMNCFGNQSNPNIAVKVVAAKDLDKTDVAGLRWESDVQNNLYN